MQQVKVVFFFFREFLQSLVDVSSQFEHINWCDWLGVNDGHCLRCCVITVNTVKNLSVYVYTRCSCIAETFYTTIRQPSSASQPANQRNKTCICVCKMCLCCRNVLYNNPAAKECVELFLTHSLRPVMMIIQITGHNRARQRDKWARLLEEFAALQDEVQ